MKSRTTQSLNWAFCFMAFLLTTPIARAVTVTVEATLNTQGTAFQSSTGSALSSFTMQIGYFTQTPAAWDQVNASYLTSNFKSVGTTVTYNSNNPDYLFSGSIPTSGDLRAFLVIQSATGLGIFNWSTALFGPSYLLSTDDSNGGMYFDTGNVAPESGRNLLTVISPLVGSISGVNGSAILTLASTSTSQTQSITFNTIPSKSVGDSFDLSASSSSGLAVTFESSDSSVAEIISNRVTIKKSGPVTITAKQAGGVGTGGVSFSSASAPQSFTCYPSTSLKVSSFGTPTYSAGTGQTSVTHTFTGNPNALYAIEYKTDLAAANWSPLLSPVQTNSGSFQVTISVAGDVTSTWKNKFFIRARNS
jgi:hypothetical protein